MFGSFPMQQVVGFEDPESVWKHPLKVRGHPFLDLPGGGVRLDDSEIIQIPMPDVDAICMPYVVWRTGTQLLSFSFCVGH